MCQMEHTPLIDVVAFVKIRKYLASQTDLFYVGMAGTGVLPFVRGVDFTRNDFKVD